MALRAPRQTSGGGLAFERREAELAVSPRIGDRRILLGLHPIEPVESDCRPSPHDRTIVEAAVAGTVNMPARTPSRKLRDRGRRRRTSRRGRHDSGRGRRVADGERDQRPPIDPAQCGVAGIHREPDTLPGDRQEGVDITGVLDHRAQMMVGEAKRRPCALDVVGAVGSVRVPKEHSTPAASSRGARPSGWRDGRGWRCWSPEWTNTLEPMVEQGRRWGWAAAISAGHVERARRLADVPAAHQVESVTRPGARCSTAESRGKSAAQLDAVKLMSRGIGEHRLEWGNCHPSSGISSLTQAMGLTPKRMATILPAVVCLSSFHKLLALPLQTWNRDTSGDWQRSQLMPHPRLLSSQDRSR